MQQKIIPGPGRLTVKPYEDPSASKEDKPSKFAEISVTISPTVWEVVEVGASDCVPATAAFHHPENRWYQPGDLVIIDYGIAPSADHKGEQVMIIRSDNVIAKVVRSVTQETNEA